MFEDSETVYGSDTTGVNQASKSAWWTMLAFLAERALLERERARRAGQRMRSAAW